MAENPLVAASAASAGFGMILAGAVRPIVDDVRQVAGVGRIIDEELIAAAVRGWSGNTRRAFRSDLSLWARWCQDNHVAAASAEPGHVAAWIRALAGMEASHWDQRAMATIERYLVNVGWAYRMAGLDDPVAAPLVKLEKKAARKARGVRQRQATALRFKGDIADLDSPAAGVSLLNLLKACRRDELGLRDAALLRLAYDSGMRRSELVAVQVGHIEGPNESGAGALFVPTSKTDQAGEGAWAYLSPQTMVSIALWRDKAGINAGPLFRRVETHFDGSVAAVGMRALHPNSITLIYRRLLRAAHAKKLLGEMGEKDLERWVASVSSHSIRVGVAQDAIAAGEGLPAIMQAYRWRDPKTVMRYGAKLATQSGASARLAARFAEDQVG